MNDSSENFLWILIDTWLTDFVEYPKPLLKRENNKHSQGCLTWVAVITSPVPGSRMIAHSYVIMCTIQLITVLENGAFVGIRQTWDGFELKPWRMSIVSQCICPRLLCLWKYWFNHKVYRVDLVIGVELNQILIVTLKGMMKESFSGTSGLLDKKCKKSFHPRRCKTSSVGRSTGLAIQRSSVRSRQKLKNQELNPTWIWAT